MENGETHFAGKNCKTSESMWLNIATQLSWVLYGKKYSDILGKKQFIFNYTFFPKLKKLVVELPKEVFPGITGNVKNMLKHASSRDIEVEYI